MATDPQQARAAAYRNCGSLNRVCGRYAAAKDTATLVDEFQVEAVLEPAPAASFNVAPTDQVALVVDRPVDEQVQRQLRRARWGLVPSWAKDPSIGSRMINARWENAAQKPAFRAAFARRRALIPADGYFEWYLPRPPPRAAGRRSSPTSSIAATVRRWPSPGSTSSGDPRRRSDWLVSVSVLTTDSRGRWR